MIYGVKCIMWGIRIDIGCHAKCTVQGVSCTGYNVHRVSDVRV